MRSTMNTSKILLLAACLGPAAGSHAQDAQLSQFDAAPILLNPALTGMYEGSDFRMSSNLRSQWNSIGNTFLTTAFVPQEALTGWLSTVATYNPVTYVLEGLRSLITEGWVWDELLAGAAASLGLMVVSFGLASMTMRGRTSRG